MTEGPGVVLKATKKKRKVDCPLKEVTSLVDEGETRLTEKKGFECLETPESLVKVGKQKYNPKLNCVSSGSLNSCLGSAVNQQGASLAFLPLIKSGERHWRSEPLFKPD